MLAKRSHISGSWRIATVSPDVAIADPLTNGQRIVKAIHETAASGTNLIALPELAVSSYTAGDLFHSSTLRDGSKEALKHILEQTKDVDAVIVVGAPYEAANGRLYNVAFVMRRGKILGAVPKSYLPNYKEFYEERYFQSGRGLSLSVSDSVLGDFRLDANQLFDVGGVRIAVEVCEDGWAPLPPSRRGFGAGAHLVVNLSASNEAIGKDDFRREMVRDLSAHGGGGYVYVSSGSSESTTDVVFGGHSMVAQDGLLVAESERFKLSQQVTLATVSFDKLPEREINEDFYVVDGGALPRLPSTAVARDPAAGAAVATTAVPSRGETSAIDWRQHGYRRIAFQTDLASGDPEAEITVIDTPKEADPNLLRARTHGISVVRHGRQLSVVANGQVADIADVPYSPDTKLSQYEIGDHRFAVLRDADEQQNIPASTWHALAGATTLIVWVDELDARKKRYYEQQAARLNAAILVVARQSAHQGGARVVAIENGTSLFVASANAVFDVDCGKLRHDRVQNTTFGKSGGAATPVNLTRVAESPALHSLARSYSKTPFVPSEGSELARRSEAILTQQAIGLVRRWNAAKTQMTALGVSGGSDSTLTFLVYLIACQEKGWDPREHIYALSLPGFGTTARTRGQAARLGAAVGIEVREKDIRALALEALRLDDHPIWKAVAPMPYRGMGGAFRRLGGLSGRPLPPEAYFPYIAQFPKLQDPDFENAQARARTYVLMQKAFTLGTGDMSELALGWATYNADHMAMYNPNSSIPKTLVKHLIRWYAMNRADGPLKQVLLEILDTPVSPELTSPNPDGTIAQVTEEKVGPYILNDYFLFHFLRNGFSARKIFSLACRDFAEGTPGKDQFEPAVIRHWIEAFFRRFYAQQYKRTVIPPGPQIGSVSLSSRGVWRMPDEASVKSEIADIETWP